MTQWILLRGLTRETRHWGAFEATMRAHRIIGEDERVTFIDLPGNGDEHARIAPLSVHALTDFVRTRALSLGVSMPCRVLAMSLGAMVATAWAQQYPDEIERLVLINTSMRPFARTYERLRPSAWRMLMRIVANWNDAHRCEQLIHRLTCHRTDTFDADLAQWAAFRRTHGASAANAWRQLLAAARFRACSTPPRCPTLLLSSAQDELVNPVCSARIAQKWGAAHVVHAWAGHDLPHDDAGWTCDAITTWLEQNNRGMHAPHSVRA
jgi:pimeloyl-ACP methyl ester carboxylesterase